MRLNRQKSRILIVDDNDQILDTLTSILHHDNYYVICAKSGDECLEILRNEEVDLIFLDLILPDCGGIDVLKKIMHYHPQQVVVMISGHGTIETAVNATRTGAYDFLEKPLEAQRVLLTAKNALERIFLEREKDILLEEARKRFKMIGISRAMKDIFKIIDRVAPLQSRILIKGESGTGKELVARAIHFNSVRSGAPFHSLNCAAIPETLIESELFGHVKGAFTGAVTNKKGVFSLSHQGTLFLDEIADLSLMAQAKVLRVIEEGEITPIGGEKEEKVDVRIICATNRHLEEMIDQGKFRDDLYHRINVVNIHIPPLRERQEDILPLAEYFAYEKCIENSIVPKKLHENAISILTQQEWKGNARELCNFIERLVIMTDGEIITGKEVLTALHLKEINEQPYVENDFKSARENFERIFILCKLMANDWKVAATAQLIGLERTHLYRKIKQLNIDEFRTL